MTAAALVALGPSGAARADTGPAAVHLVAFSPAGAGGHAYRGWADALDPDVMLSGVRLPGRESRLGEQPVDSIAGLAPPLVEEIAALPGAVALFGHSFGALLAYAVGVRLAAAGRAPHWVGLAGIGPAAADLRLDPDAEDDDLVQAVQRLDPVSVEPALLRATLPALRADIRAAREFLPVRGPALPCPVGVFGGRADVGRDELMAWRDLAAGELILRRYPGGHFFLLHTPRPVVRDICGDLRRAAPNPGQANLAEP